MTGLPPVSPRPPSLTPPDIVTGAARAWLDASLSCATAGAGAAGALRRSPGAWEGSAATAAARRAHELHSDAVVASDTGLAGVVAVASFAHALRRLAATRTALLTRIDDEAAALAHLALEPDTRPDAPALRRVAWELHRRLTDELHAWQQRGREAEESLIAALTQLTGHSGRHHGTHHDLLDAAHRALLLLDASPAAEATREALRDGGSEALLLAFDPDAFDGDGAVVIAHGDPATADHLAVVVPGMTTDATSIRDVSAMAVAVAGAAAQTTRRTTSAIAWVGYDAPADHDLARGRLHPRDLPDIVRVADDRAAEEGGSELVEFVDGLAGRDVTVIGHSYGSTTAAHAAADGMDADRLVLLGSPGAGREVDEAADVRLPTWVAADDLDPVTWIGRAGPMGVGPLGVDPAHRDFGATRLPTDPVTAPRLDQTRQFIDIHASYLAPGSTSLDAIASVVVGRTPPTVPARTARGTGLAADWLAGQAAYELTSWR